MTTVEVFKTNVSSTGKARRLIAEIERAFSSYQANFDLDDCDRILRVESRSARIETHCLMDLLSTLGVEIEILEDVVPSEYLQKI